MTEKIESSMQEDRRFPPSDAFVGNARIKTPEAYQAMYQRSIDEPEAFWGEYAESELEWMQKWDSVLEWDWSNIGTKEGPYTEWFKGGKLNVSVNCIDRHVAAGKGERVALIWEDDAGDETRHVTYAELKDDVCKFANVLKAQGAKKGTVVTIYMPMVPEAVVAMQACARIGAIHSVVFSAFSADNLAGRVNDSASEIIITADGYNHRGKNSVLKPKADEAATKCPSVRKLIVLRRSGETVNMQDGRDVYWQDETANASAECEPEAMDAEDPLFLLYTSGSTGKPKGVLHTTAGYLLYTHMTMKYIFDVREDDVFWCTADVGWITGHSYLCYGPLSNGAQCVLFEGVPTYPEPDRFWRMVDDHKVTIFYTAPTALRALMRLGDDWVNKHDLSSLRLLGSVGEPINPEAWMWYHDVIGKGNCPITDTWWQTETGGHMIMTAPGAHATKPGCAGVPFLGVKTAILRADGSEVDTNEGGSLCVVQPWPGMIRGVYGDAVNARVKSAYYHMFDGLYFSGDGARQDEDGYIWLLGRMDDVINVSGHRFATAEFESSLVGYDDVAEAAVVGYPHEIKGQGVYCFVTLKAGLEATDELQKALVAKVRADIGPIGKPDKIHFTPALPKTRSGKIMRRILRKIAAGELELGDTSTLADPSVVDALVEGRL